MLILWGTLPIVHSFLQNLSSIRNFKRATGYRFRFTAQNVNLHFLKWSFWLCNFPLNLCQRFTVFQEPSSGPAALSLRPARKRSHIQTPHTRIREEAGNMIKKAKPKSLLLLEGAFLLQDQNEGGQKLSTNQSGLTFCNLPRLLTKYLPGRYRSCAKIRYGISASPFLSTETVHPCKGQAMSVSQSVFHA